MTDIEQIKNNSFFEGYKQATEQANGCIKQIRAEIADYKDNKLIHSERNEMIDIVLEIIDKCTGSKAK